MPVDVNFMVGGEAGQGVQSVGFLLAKALARGGYHVFADQDYESRIRGGHNFFRVRAGTAGVSAIAGAVDILVALNRETIDRHRAEMARTGIMLYDGDQVKDLPEGGNLFSVPLDRLAQEKAGDKVMSNTVAFGAVLGLVGYDFGIGEKLLRDHFGAKDGGEANVKAARAGFDYARESYKGDTGYHLPPCEGKWMLLTGDEAISVGAIAAGCKFVAAYPMTPTTPILEYLAAKAKDYDLAVLQPEDEISAMNMVIGASFAGVRSMTATSGSGFALMVEGLGLAGMTETPIVVVLGMRPAPAVGMPTRTDQGDLEFALYAAPGEFPRAILAPANIEDCFWSTTRAFNLAEKYQVPVIILIDHHLATSYATVNRFDLSKVTIDRGPLYTTPAGGDQYRRHLITPTGISPRAFPGQPGVLVATDSDEHDESGHLTEDAEIRTRMVQKRLRKFFSLKEEVAPPLAIGPKRAETVLIGWGSTYGAIHEAVTILRREGLNVNGLHLNQVWPFPVEAVVDALAFSRASYVVEGNATGQLARLIRAMTGKEVTGRILRYDGRPFTPASIIDQVKKEVCCRWW